jgi:hypothetical protein
MDILIYLFIYSSLLSLCNHLVMKDQPPILFLTDNIHSDTQAEPRKLSSLTLYIDLWQEGKPAPGRNPPVISPPVGIFRRIGVRAEIRTQNPVLPNTRLVKMVPLSHLRRLYGYPTPTTRLNDGIFRIHWFSVVTPARLHKSDFDSTYTAVHLTTHREIFYLHVELFWGLYAPMGGFYFWICWDYSCAFCLCFGLCSLGWRTTVKWYIVRLDPYQRSYF